MQGRSVPWSELKQIVGVGEADEVVLLPSTVVKTFLLVVLVSVGNAGVFEVTVTVRVDEGTCDLELDLTVSVRVSVKVEVSTSTSQTVFKTVMPGVGVTLGNA